MKEPISVSPHCTLILSADVLHPPYILANVLCLFCAPHGPFTIIKPLGQQTETTPGLKLTFYVSCTGALFHVGVHPAHNLGATKNFHRNNVHFKHFLFYLAA